MSKLRYYQNSIITDYLHKVVLKTFFCLLLVIHIITGFSALYAQPLPIVQEKQSKEGFENARSFYDQKIYTEALKLYQKLLLEDPDNSNLNFLVGECLMNIPGSEKEALLCMQKAVKNVLVDYENTPLQRKAPVFAFEKLGDLLYQDYKFEDALTNYRSFKTYLDAKKDKVLTEQINRKIEISTTAKQLVDNPLKLTLTELPFLNVISFNDYSGRMSTDGNTIYFTRKRISTSGNPGNSDIYSMRKVEAKWSRPVRMPFINTEKNDEFCWISEDENQMILSSDRDGKYNLYITERKGKSQWTQPEMLNANINAKGEVTFGCITHDGRILYFISDKKGGLGGKDIYRSILSTNNDWGQAENLGPNINTSFDEEAPFISRDGKTLYFSSKGFKNMGGYDIFYSILNTANNWSDPVNVGYPINTTVDDLYYNRSYQGKPEYFVSRSRTDINEFSINVLNSSEAGSTLTETKTKENLKDKTKLKLVPKTLKY